MVGRSAPGAPLLVLRPSRDLGRIASEYEADLPPAFRFLTRGLGTREMRSNSMLSLIMFHPGYLRRLLDLGEADARARASELSGLLNAGNRLFPGHVHRSAARERRRHGASRPETTGGVRA